MIRVVAKEDKIGGMSLTDDFFADPLPGNPARQRDLRYSARSSQLQATQQSPHDIRPDGKLTSSSVDGPHAR